MTCHVCFLSGGVAVSSSDLAGGAQRAGGRRIVLLVFLVCFVPFVLAWLAYSTRLFEGRNNYGTLIDPQVDIPATVAGTRLGGEPFDVAALKGKWVLFQVASGRCDEACQQMMFYQRQIRTSTGKEQGRIERVVFLIDDEPVETLLLRQFEGVHFVRTTPADIQGWLPLPPDTVASQSSGDPLARLQTHVFLADPLGHVMMRFPAQPDWAKVRKDISKLLWASKIG